MKVSVHQLSLPAMTTPEPEHLASISWNGRATQHAHDTHPVSLKRRGAPIARFQTGTLRGCSPHSAQGKPFWMHWRDALHPPYCGRPNVPDGWYPESWQLRGAARCPPRAPKPPGAAVHAPANPYRSQPVCANQSLKSCRWTKNKRSAVVKSPLDTQLVPGSCLQVTSSWSDDFVTLLTNCSTVDHLNWL